MNILIVMIGGSLGAVMRYGIIVLLPPSVSGFSYATLLVNVSGSLLAGFIVGVLAYTAVIDEMWRLFLLVGILSSFTTFCTFSTETMQYFLAEQYLSCIANIVFNLVFCLLAVFAGFTLAKLAA